VKKKKTKTNKYDKNSILKICLLAAILLGILIILYFFLTAEDDDNKLTLIEKQWIEKNKSSLININVPNNLSILGSNGEGVLFDYVKSVEKKSGLTFNMVSYNYPLASVSDSGDVSILVLTNKDELKSDDILIMEDSYVLASSNSEAYASSNESVNSNLGVLREDKATLMTLLGKNTYTYKEYNSIDNLIKAIKDSQIDYMIVPRYANLTKIMENNLYINYDFSNISNKIVLRSGNTEKLNTILTKCLETWKKDDYQKDYEASMMKFYKETNNVSEADLSQLSTKVYKYGFVTGSSYNVLKNDNVYGIAGEYVNSLKEIAKMDIEMIPYATNQKLSDAIKKGEVDFAFIDYDYTNDSGYNTSNLFNSKLVGLSRNYKDITNKNGLINRKLYLLERGYLYKYVKDNFDSNINPIKSINANLPNDGILVLDDTEYMYNARNLSSYNLLFIDEYSSGYHFFINSSNETLYNLMDFKIKYIDYNDHKNISMEKLLNTISNESSFKQIYLLIICIILIPLFILLLAVVITKTKSRLNLNKKEAALKYNDVLTSLKNRNYLNDNMELWDETKISPRTIIMMDLNNIKYVNDNYGHEEGNNLIKKAAAILINNQLQNSEIIRTDGNEFLIYLIGYNQNQIKTYINKLSKEFEKLPYGFGAAIGYSMINDEIKTIDDAINEASIEMRTNKEQSLG